jgi:hypothetical protein
VFDFKQQQHTMGNTQPRPQASSKNESDNTPKEKVYLNVYTIPTEELPKWLSSLPGSFESLSLSHTHIHSFPEF